MLLLIGVMYLLPSRKNSPIKFPKKWTFEPKLIKDIVVIAIPSAIQSAIRSVAFLAMTTIIAVYGTAAVAAYGIWLGLDFMGLVIVMGLCTGVAVMVGQNLGAGKVERAVKTVRYAATANAVFMAGVAALYLVFATEFLKFFGATDESLADGTMFMQIVPLSYFLVAIAMTMGFAMNGAGMTRPGMYSVIAGQLITQVGLAAFFALSGYSIQYIWYAVVCGTVVMFCFDLFFYMRGGLKTKKLRIDSDEAPAAS